jgi:hypothetical protein
MKPIVLAACLLALCLCAPVHAADADETDYVAGMEDLPLMPGLKANPAATTDFDQPEGRIVEVTANGVVDADGVRQYYARTLPQLGWKPVAAGRYVREGETLAIQAQPNGAGASVHFTVTPSGGLQR